MATFPHGQYGNSVLLLVAAVLQTGQGYVTTQLHSIMAQTARENVGKVQHVATQFAPSMATFLNGLSGMNVQFHVGEASPTGQGYATTRHLSTMELIVWEIGAKTQLAGKHPAPSTGTSLSGASGHPVQ